MMMIKSALPLSILFSGFVFQSGCTTIKSDLLDKKVFTVIEVNGYRLPSPQTEIKAQFKDGKVFLLGSCNPTWGHYSIEGGFITLNAIGHLGQTACTEIIDTPDGSHREIIGRLPSVRTEEEFIKIGNDKFRFETTNEEVRFIRSDGQKTVILLKEH